MQSFNTEPDDALPSTETKQTFSVCPVEALPNGSCRRLSLPNGDELAVYNVNGEFYATENFCPHRGAPLTDGLMTGHVVECGWHGWQFDVRTGECLTVTDTLRTFRVRVEEGMVLVAI
jgi:nitrite reductase/ring-hydroxylating ferredoxin subunit